MVKIFLKPSLHKAKSTTSNLYSQSTLFPILPLEDLLPEIEKEHYLHKIKQIAQIPDDYFTTVYVDLIDNFAKFVQLLPEFYGGELGGLLNNGLRRGLLSLQIYQETHSTKIHPLFLFAVFSIALLSDLGQILQFKTSISDETGAYIDDWYPHLGFMIEFGDYYKFRPYEEAAVSLIKGVTPLFARQLLSETAITWISSNSKIHDMWLAFLHKGDDWESGLLKILKIDPKQFELRMGEIDLFPIDATLETPLDTELGEQFLEWLQDALKEGAISFNEVDSLVHVVAINELDIGVFLHAPDLFQLFCNKFVTGGKNWVSVCQQFNALGMTDIGGYDYQIRQFFLESPQSSNRGFLGREKMRVKDALQQKKLASQSLKGMLVKDAKLIFPTKTPPVSQHLNLDKRVKMETTSLPKKPQKQASTKTVSHQHTTTSSFK